MIRATQPWRPATTRALWLAGAAFISITVPTVAAAAENEVAVEEVVVTVRHREENLQKVPASVSAVGGEFLEATNTTGISDLTRFVPSLQFQFINPRNSQINIRGLGNAVGLANDGLDPGVGFYVDGVYYNRSATASFDLIDLENVQVLNGPQGTLYGKNTTAGAISVTTAAPAFQPAVSLEATGGNYDYYQLKGSVTGPILGDKVAGRLSVSKTSRGGFQTNVVTGKEINDYDNLTVRGQLLFAFTEDFKVRVIGDYSKQNTICCSAILTSFWTPPSGANFVTTSAAFGSTPVLGKVQVNAPVKANQDTGGVSAEATWTLPNAVLTSISAWRYWDWRPASDLLQSALDDFRQSAVEDDQEQFTQEFRVASTGEHTVDYVGGLFLYHEVVEGRSITEYGSAATGLLISRALPALILQDVKLRGVSKYNTTSYAGFGQLTWHATPQLSVTGGLRYTHDDKRGTYNALQSGGLPLAGPLAAFAAIRGAFATNNAYKVKVKDGAWGGHLDVAYQATDDVLGYASYSRGNRSNGLNLNQLPAGATSLIGAETIDAFEAGLKMRLLDRRMTLNASVFAEDDKGYQANTVDPILLRTYLANIPQVRARGFEITTQARPSEAWSLYGALSYVDAIHVRFPTAPCPVETPLPAPASCNFNGTELPGTPKWTASFGFEYHRPVSLAGREAEFYVGADDSYRSGFSNSGTNSIYSRLPNRNLVNGRLGVRSAERTWDAYLWGKNLGDVDFYNSKTAVNSGYIFGFKGEPRTYGATLRLRY